MPVKKKAVGKQGAKKASVLRKTIDTTYKNNLNHLI